VPTVTTPALHLVSTCPRARGTFVVKLKHFGEEPLPVCLCSSLSLHRVRREEWMWCTSCSRPSKLAGHRHRCSTCALVSASAPHLHLPSPRLKVCEVFIPHRHVSHRLLSLFRFLALTYSRSRARACPAPPNAHIAANPFASLPPTGRPGAPATAGGSFFRWGPLGQTPTRSALLSSLFLFHPRPDGLRK
jgi:hypothetical protein